MREYKPDPVCEETMRRIVSVGYRTLARDMHPDVGGTNEEMAQLNHAMDWLRKILGMSDWAPPQSRANVEGELVWWDRVQVMRETDKAFLVLIGAQRIWIPHSQVVAGTNIFTVGDVGRLVIPLWLARAKGFDLSAAENGSKNNA